MNVRQGMVAVGSGILFGLGLALSQMIDPQRVLGFLDVAGDWDPTLAFVMGGAVLVTVVAFRFILKRPHPLFSERFYLPTRRDIDAPLLLGAAIFGIGWGIGGYCPGPALTSLVLGGLNPLLFIAAMVAGSLTQKGYSRHTPLPPQSVQPPHTEA